MIVKNDENYDITVYYPKFLDKNLAFIQEMSFRARSIHRIHFSMLDGSFKTKSNSFDNAKVIQEDLVKVITRFLRY